MSLQKSIFRELDRTSRTPAIIHGSGTQLMETLRTTLSQALQPNQYCVYSSLNVVEARALAKLILLSECALEYVVVDASKVSEKAWETLLKPLEANVPPFRLWFVNTSSVPENIKTRCFVGYAPATDEGDSTAEQYFSVGSWLIGVDERSRERLLTACEDWTKEHNLVLIEQLSNIILDDYSFGVPMEHTSKKQLFAAMNALCEYSGSPAAALSIGLGLISQ